VCKRVDKTKSYINRSDVHWGIKGRRRCGTKICGSIDNIQGHRGGKCCWGETIAIHKSEGGITTIHKGVRDGRNTRKGDGDGEAWVGSSS